mmetsp:Transcript_9217/g.28284  ORF Transcript_9217/g.28284 Transcript_9217/m.28284 type:complete len:261 (+) Transcript_9217:484-1266(+)
MVLCRSRQNRAAAKNDAAEEVCRLLGSGAADVRPFSFRGRVSHALSEGEGLEESDFARVLRRCSRRVSSVRGASRALRRVRRRRRRLDRLARARRGHFDVVSTGRRQDPRGLSAVRRRRRRLGRSERDDALPHVRLSRGSRVERGPAERRRGRGAGGLRRSDGEASVRGGGHRRGREVELRRVRKVVRLARHRRKISLSPGLGRRRAPGALGRFTRKGSSFRVRRLSAQGRQGRPPDAPRVLFGVSDELSQRRGRRVQGL